MIDQLITIVATLVVFLTGYYVGKEKSPLTPEIISKVKRIADFIPRNKGLGAVERPSVIDLDRMSNPLKKGEDEAMAETLRDIIRP